MFPSIRKPNPTSEIPHKLWGEDRKQACDFCLYPYLSLLFSLLPSGMLAVLMLPILFSSPGTTQGYEDIGEGDENISRKPGNVLKTLDPILITIIAMSALGVLLGAVCGVVLYCACWHNGMSERNLSALENYNFELVDGVKLKKDKLNTQSTYSEA